jgi:hypothetical protein
MSQAFVDRHPNPDEIEKLRLLLSTYQDGSGMLSMNTVTLPGWRDFERSVALAFNGTAQESKFIFDVLLQHPANHTVYYGLSCKMRKELRKLNLKHRASMELSNSSGKFWQHLARYDINQANYLDRPTEVGMALIELVNSWHYESHIEGRLIDLKHSFYLVLSWDQSSGWYQLHQFPLQLPNPQSLVWSNPQAKDKPSRRIIGKDENGVVLEWYGESGGQLKYYPLVDQAIWVSEPFKLEPLPELIQNIVLDKAARYFPNLWAKIQ